MENNKTFISDFIDELNRARELLIEYQAIPTGFFGATIIKQHIFAAEKALKESNVVDMLKCYEHLQGLE